MNKIARFLLGLVLAIAPVTAAFGQSLTPACSNPPPNYGVVWTSGQWIACLSSFQAYLGYTPLNVAGGAMLGELTLQTSVTANAPLNFPAGVAPTSPVNGDLWFTTSGLFYRAGGSSIGPLASTTSPTFSSPTFTGTVTFPDSTTWTSTTITPGTALTALFASPPAIGGTSAASAHFTTLFASGAFSGATASFTTATATSIALGGATIGSNALAATGTANISGTATIGSGSTDNVQIAGGASGGTITTNGGTLTVSSGAGTGTKLADSVVTLTNAGYSNCAILGTAVGGAITCGGAPSGYITYNDDITMSTAAVTGNLYCMDTASGALTLTLPASPGNGAYVAFSDCGGNFGLHALTIARNGSSIMYSAGDMTVSQPYAGGVLRYSTGKTSWILSPL